MIFTEIKELIELFSKHKLTELSISDETAKVELKKNIEINTEKKVYLKDEANIENIAKKEVEEKKEKEEIIPLEEKYTEVKAPLVGVFYSATSEDSDPFVKENDYVKKGDIICLIEAMKMMSEIKAPVDGYIRKINVKNESLVEFDSILFLIEENNNV